MSRLQKLIRLVSFMATTPALLLGALSVRAQTNTPTPPALKQTTTQAPIAPSSNVVAFVKMCCLNLVGYNRKGATLLTAQDGQPFTISETGQKVRFKMIQNDIAAPGGSSDRIKITSSDIAAKAKHLTSDINTKNSNDDSFFKFKSAHNNIDVIGVNAQKQTIFKNQRGEVFTINPMNGDMVFIK